MLELFMLELLVDVLDMLVLLVEMLDIEVLLLEVPVAEAGAGHIDVLEVPVLVLLADMLGVEHAVVLVVGQA